MYAKMLTFSQQLKMHGVKKGGELPREYLHSTKYVFAVSFFILYVHKLLPPIKSCLACINWSWLPWVTAFNDPRELLFTAGE